MNEGWELYVCIGLAGDRSREKRERVVCSNLRLGKESKVWQMCGCVSCVGFGGVWKFVFLLLVHVLVLDLVVLVLVLIPPQGKLVIYECLWMMKM